MNVTPKHKPPKRKPGWGKGARRLSGEAMDVRTTSELMGDTELGVRGKIARGILPYRRLEGCVICLRSEILEYLQHLPGVSLEEACANVLARRGTPL
jgi:hypothetical protein